MRVYADSSALIKRSVAEPESDALESALEQWVSDEAAIVASSLAWIEVSRAISSAYERDRRGHEAMADAIDVAMSGIAERTITDDIVSLARRITPAILRSLDAIHLATAIVLDVDLVVTYDDRLDAACKHNGLATSAPGTD